MQFIRRLLRRGGQGVRTKTRQTSAWTSPTPPPNAPPVVPAGRAAGPLVPRATLHPTDQRPTLDNGPEFLALRLTDWAEQRNIALDLIQCRASRRECVHRALQPNLPHGGPGCARLRVARRGPGDHDGLAATLQHGAAPRQPRPRAAAHVFAEGNQRPGVPPSGGYVTGAYPPKRVVSFLDEYGGSTANRKLGRSLSDAVYDDLTAKPKVRQCARGRLVLNGGGMAVNSSSRASVSLGGKGQLSCFISYVDQE
jgi:hypothetical protein